MRTRSAFTLFSLLVILAILALLFALLLPLLAKYQAQQAENRQLNNLRQLGLASHNYHDANGRFPAGVNSKTHFSATALLLPYVEQDNVYRNLNLQKPITDKANQDVAAQKIPVLLSPRDPLQTVKKDQGATNYLWNAGSQPALKNNDGVFYEDSALRITDITDGTSNTLMAAETLKGDGSDKAVDVRRQHVALKADALKNLKDDAGAVEWKDGKNIAGDRGASWIDGRFLQGTFTATRLPNDARPDVNCEGQGGLSGLRSLNDRVGVVFCDGFARMYNANQVKIDVWRALATRSGGEVVNPDF